MMNVTRDTMNSTRTMNSVRRIMYRSIESSFRVARRGRGVHGTHAMGDLRPDLPGPERGVQQVRCSAAATTA
jgi:hypothetical protein